MIIHLQNQLNVSLSSMSFVNYYFGSVITINCYVYTILKPSVFIFHTYYVKSYIIHRINK